jgi:hypothetical protein
MSNPQGSGKQGRKDAKQKASQQHHQTASPPGRSEQHQAAPRGGEHGHTQHPGQPHSSRQSMEEDEET